MEIQRYAERKDRAKVRLLLLRWGNVNRMCNQLNRELDAMTQMRQRIMSVPDKEREELQQVLQELNDNIRQLAQNCAAELKFSRAFVKRMMALDGAERRVLFLRYWEDCSYVQIANRINRSIDHVKRREAVAVDKLSSLLRR